MQKNECFAERLKAARVAAGMSQAAAAQAAGVHHKYWCMMEQGIRDPAKAYLATQDRLTGLAAVLGCSLDDLLPRGKHKSVKSVTQGKCKSVT